MAITGYISHSYFIATVGVTESTGSHFWLYKHRCQMTEYDIHRFVHRNELEKGRENDNMRTQQSLLLMTDNNIVFANHICPRLYLPMWREPKVNRDNYLHINRLHSVFPRSKHIVPCK